MIWTNKIYIMTDDPKALDLDVVCEYLQDTYWGTEEDPEDIKKSFENSIPFTVTRDGKRVGFMRVVSDKARFSWFGDVFIIPERRGQGLGGWMMENAMSHPDIINTKMLLGTKDAHSFYEKLGFVRKEKLQYQLEATMNNEVCCG